MNKICGLAVARGDWDYLDEVGNWHYEKMGRLSNYFQSYDDLILRSDQIDDRWKLQEYYKSIGYKPTDPTSALNQLKQRNFLSLNDNFHLLENKPPFQIVIKAKLNKLFIKTFEGKGEALDKRIARVLASADICEQIFLEYDMSDLKIRIDENEKGDFYRIEKRIVK